MKLSRQEYFKKQRDISRMTANAELEAARRIRKATRELVLPLVRQYAEQGMITYPVEELSKKIDHIIREEAAKPVEAAKKLQDDMEASLAEKLGVTLHHRPEPQENARQRRLENAREPVGKIIKTPGRGWGYGTSGLASYHRDPQTGKIVWDDLPLEYQFRKRADLSSQVWKAVEEQEKAVFDVIRGGRAAGRNVKQISSDLETYINYKDGGERVVGRWMGMFPNTEAGRKEAWAREYLKDHGGLQPGSDAAKALLRQPDAQAWVKQKMAETTKRGTPRLPDAVKQYATRLGKAGLDYQAIRIARSETTAMVADEQLAIAENSDICTGEMDFVMDRGRDHWNCSCERYAEQNPWRVDDPERPEIPVHPNCMCEWRPRLKTDAEILASLREEMKEDLETIEGTEEQKDMLERIDTTERIGLDDLDREIIQKEEVKTLEQFSPEFNRFMDDVKGKIGNTYWSDLPRDAKDEMNRKLKEARIDLDGEMFLKEIDKVITDGEIVRHQKLDTLLNNMDDFEKDPRIKTLFETGTSEGNSTKDFRNNWELSVSRIPSQEFIDNGHLTGEGAWKFIDDRIGGVENRPVYAEIIPSGSRPEEGAAKTYGGLHMVLSNNIRDRVTYTSADSANMNSSFIDTAATSLLNQNGKDLDYNNMNNLIQFFQSAKSGENATGNYFETQIWGGIDLSRGDVSKVVIGESSRHIYRSRGLSEQFNRLLSLFNKYGITVEFYED